MERLFKAALFTKETHTEPIIVSIYILKTKETRICTIIALHDIYAARANEYLDSSVTKILQPHKTKTCNVLAVFKSFSTQGT